LVRKNIWCLRTDNRDTDGQSTRTDNRYGRTTDTDGQPTRTDNRYGRTTDTDGQPTRTDNRDTDGQSIRTDNQNTDGQPKYLQELPQIFTTHKPLFTTHFL